ncbi:hypothetical protein U1Q18_034940 [Sarracenia purpurea var. burkii]
MSNPNSVQENLIFLSSYGLESTSSISVPKTSISQTYIFDHWNSVLDFSEYESKPKILDATSLEIWSKDIRPSSTVSVSNPRTFIETDKGSGNENAGERRYYRGVRKQSWDKERNAISSASGLVKEIFIENPRHSIHLAIQRRRMERRGSDRHLRNCRAMASPSSTGFYKIILPSIMHHHKLRIPEDFANKYGNELSTLAALTVPSGQIWHVRVEKADNMLWFNDGWKVFAEHHSICCGFFVVFNYEGNSKFNVLIFDLTASEIHNPRNTISIPEKTNCRKQCLVSDKGEMGGDDIVETLCCSISRPDPVSSDKKFFDECLDQRKIGKRRYHSLPHTLFEFAPEFALRMKKRGRCIFSLESLLSNADYLRRNKRCKMQDQGKMIKLEHVTISCRGKPKASEMPYSHMSLLDKPKKKKRGLTKNAGLNLPSFNNANQITDSNEQWLKVRSEEEVELLGVNNSRNFSKRQPVMTQEREKALNAAMMFKPKNPYFMVILKLYNVHKSYVLNLPGIFARKYLHGVSKSIELQVSGGRQWTVRCLLINGTRQCLSCGWSTFVKENHLVEGDVCVFELIQLKNVVLKVTIFRAGERRNAKT